MAHFNSRTPPGQPRRLIRSSARALNVHPWERANQSPSKKCCARRGMSWLTAMTRVSIARGTVSHKLADKIARLVKYEGAIRWDTSKPNGQPRRKLDVSRAAERFGFHAKTDFDEGLAKTYAWMTT